jgi:hypothetical protein
VGNNSEQLSILREKPGLIHGYSACREKGISFLALRCLYCLAIGKLAAGLANVHTLATRNLHVKISLKTSLVLPTSMTSGKDPVKF